MIPQDIQDKILLYNIHPIAEIIKNHVSEIKKYIKRYYLYDFDNYSFYANRKNVRTFF